MADSVTLCAHELLANVDRHTGSPHCTITLRHRPDGVRVTVTDTNTDPPTSREPDEDAESGRGLALINEVAEHFGTVIRRDSKDVWAEILTSRPAALA
ncbi:ATP-binding protein [Streptomyces cyaneofuscatus]|uniref:ATP-binding protein n=1 Tax=Streptomyces cyaneofuscatus TaxID=66883 RepID=UPI00340F71F7